MSGRAPRRDPFEEAVRRLAADAAPGLLEQVLEESRREAGEIVKERLRPALVEEMTRLLSAPAVGAASSPASPAASGVATGSAGGPATASDSSVVPLVRPDRTVPSGWYVYGITRAETGEALGTVSGVDGAPVEAVSVADLAAVVSPLSDATGWDVDATAGEAALEALAPRARAHEAVLERVVDLGGVLPLRFGVMYPDIDRLKEVVRERAAAFRHALGALDGHSEWGLTITSEGRAGEPGPSPAADGRDYLSQRRAQRLSAEALADQRFRAGSEIHEVLQRASAAAVVHRSAGASGAKSHVVVRASYLVRTDSADAFREECERLLTDAPSELHLSGELTGPWPPYHFCDISLEGVPA